MAQPFLNRNPTIDGPSVGSFLITPADGSDLSSDIRQLTINVAGTVAYIGWDGVAYATDTLPQGSYAVFARRIKATGTTATGLTGWI